MSIQNLLSPPKAAKYFSHNPKKFYEVVQKASRLSLSAGAAKLYFEGTLSFLISLREIRKDNVPSKLSFAAEGSGILFTQLGTFRTAP